MVAHAFHPPTEKQSDLCDFKVRLATQQILGQPGLYRKTIKNKEKTSKYEQTCTSKTISTVYKLVLFCPGP